MRVVLVVLVVANLLFAAAQLALVRALFTPDAPRIEQINAEKLRVIRDAPRPATAPAARRP